MDFMDEDLKDPTVMSPEDLAEIIGAGTVVSPWVNEDQPKRPFVHPEVLGIGAEMKLIQAWRN